MLYLQISTVYLRSSSIEMVDGFDPDIESNRVFGKWRIDSQTIVQQESNLSATEGEDNNIDKYLLVINKFVYLGFRRSDNRDADQNISIDDYVFKISADVAVCYSVKDGEYVSEDEITNFAGKNSILHVWPYWREYLQSTMLRMSLKPSIVPMFPKGFYENLRKE